MNFDIQISQIFEFMSLTADLTAVVLNGRPLYRTDSR